MKKNLFIAITMLVATIVITSCGNGNKNSGSNSNSSTGVDIPKYATMQGAYFDDIAPEGYISTYGPVDSKMGQNEYNGIRGASGSKVRSYTVEIGGEVFRLLYEDGLAVKNLTKPNYTLHVLIGGGENKPYINIPIPPEERFSDTYFFFNNDQFDKASTYLTNLNKSENLASEFKAKEAGGVKTYNSKIGAVVEYYGLVSGEKQRFLSLYLDCGAVVQLYDKNLKNLVGKSIDCVTDSRNNVIESAYKIY